MPKPSNTPWYKQFWPWFLIAVPLSSLIVGSVVFHLAINTSDSLVVDDYYKEGRVINARLDKVEHAKSLNITTALTVKDDGSVALRFITGAPRTAEALQLSFYHVTLNHKDVNLLLTQDSNGLYRGHTEQPLQGKWRVTLQPLNEQWKIQQVISLPRANEIRFTP